MNKYKVILNQQMISTDVYLICQNEAEGDSYVIIVDGNLVHNRIDLNAGFDRSKRLFTVSFASFTKGNILKAFAEALNEAKIFPEVPQREKIAAETLAEERLKELNYHKEQIKIITAQLLSYAVGKQE